jgi:tRNA modification GTPase
MKPSPTDTIVALSTPEAGAPIAIIRVSGEKAVKAFKTISPTAPALRHFHVINIEMSIPEFPVRIPASVLFMRSPKSYTTEDVVEIRVPGAMPIVKAVISALVKAGCRPAEPGEFTKRAYLGGRIDLTQAEAVNAAICASDKSEFRRAQLLMRGALGTAAQEIRDEIVLLLARLEVGIDFAEQEIELVPRGILLAQLNDVAERLDALLPQVSQRKEIGKGARALIAGRPNAGKSSIFNILAGKDKAIVHHEPGTTRDYLTSRAEISGVKFTLVDTAGIRETNELVEKTAVRESLAQIELADLVIYVVDASIGVAAEDRAILEKIPCEKAPVLNKIDLVESPAEKNGRKPKSEKISDELFPGAVQISCKTGEGIAGLRLRLEKILKGPSDFGGALAVSERHRNAVSRASASIQKAIEGLESGLSEEFLALEIRDALGALGELTGESAPDAVLDAIFSDFCIGK